MRIIPEPAPNTRLVFIGRTAPLVRDHGLYRFECGACGAPLAVDISIRELGDAVLKCPECGAYNQAEEPAG